MQFAVKDARFFKSCVDAIANLVDEGSFEATKDGLHLRTMDPSQIAMVDFKLPASALQKMEVDGKASVTLNLADFSKVLARTRSDESLDVLLDEKESKLHMTFSGDSKRVFKMPLLDANTTMPKEPNVPFDATIKMKGGALKAMLQDAGMLSSHVIFSIDESGMTLEAKGDSGDLHSETTKDSGLMASITAKGKSRAMFPYEYLNDIAKACPDDSALELCMKSDAPVRISYAIGDAQLTYYLAPRVENE